MDQLSFCPTLLLLYPKHNMVRDITQISFLNCSEKLKVKRKLTTGSPHTPLRGPPLLPHTLPEALVISLAPPSTSRCPGKNPPWPLPAPMHIIQGSWKGLPHSLLPPLVPVHVIQGPGDWSALPATTGACACHLGSLRTGPSRLPLPSLAGMWWPVCLVSLSPAEPCHSLH